MLSSTPRVWLCFSFLGLFAAASSLRAEKLFDFSFDGNGAAEASGRGAKSSVSIQLFDIKGAKADVRGPAGSGVSGKTGDRAYDGTTADDMGSLATFGPSAVTNTPIQELSSLASYTIQGWFKTEGTLPHSVARLVVCSSPDKKHPTLDLMATITPGDLLFATYSPKFDEAPANVRLTWRSFAHENEWTFFAVVYNGEMLTFFSGTPASPVTEKGKLNYNAGATDSPDAKIAIGNHTNGKRPFDGWLDNIRIFGSTKDVTGALTVQELEALRLQDVKGQ